MRIFDKCLLLSDVDGTLISEGGIPENNLRQIERFILDGGKFAIATGRCIDATRFLLESVSCNAPCVLLNGAMIYDFKSERVLFSETINDAVKPHLKQILDNPFYSDVGIEVHTDRTVCNVSKTEESEVHRIYEKLQVLETDYSGVENLAWNKVIYMFPNTSKIDRFCEFLNQSCSEYCDCIRTSAYFDNRMFNYVELLPKGANKGSAIKEYRKILGDECSSIYAIGDYYNDYNMIKLADIGAAAGNAPKDIKNIADYVACNCEQAAVGDFIEYLYRIKSKGCSK